MPDRHIILLRHAHAEPAGSSQNDASRPLTAEGIAEAETAGNWLKTQNACPTRVLCSPAARAQETCERVLALIKCADIRLDNRLYEATPGALMQIFDEHADTERLLIVGHNPGLENVVALLTEGVSDAGRGMPTASIAWLALPKDTTLEPGIAQLRYFWSAGR